MRSARRALPLLAVLALLVSPARGAGQVGRVAVGAAPGGAVLGRVCVDLDGDAACGDDEPGVAGARLRFEDGRSAVADGEGRFHALDVVARTVLSDRSAYGAHAVSVEGLGVSRSYELAPRGAAQIDLAVPPPADGGGVGTVARRGRGAPRVEGERLLWPIAGTAPPGARVRAAGIEAEAAADGTWALTVPLSEGPNAVGVALSGPDGAISLWTIELRVARPGSGPLRVYPATPRLLASMAVRPAGHGAVLTGRAAPGVGVRIGDRAVRASAEGRFGAWVDGAGGAVAVSASSGAATAEGAARLPPARDALEWHLLGELELQLGGDEGFLASGRAAATLEGRWRGLRIDAGVDLDDRDRDGLALASPRDSLAAQLVLDPLRSFVTPGDEAALADSNPGRGRLWARLDGDGFALRLGNVRASPAAGELGRHGLAFYGARLEGARQLGPARLDGNLFGGRAGEDAGGLAPGTPSQDVLLATGGSLFYLRHGQVVSGSEAVRVEWRDPLSRLTVASRPLLRGRDYELDPTGGRLLLSRPLASARPVAALVGGDPFAAAEAWLVVDYLRIDPAAGARERGVAGGEVRASSGPVTLALGGAAESRSGADWESLHGSAALDLGEALVARVELARSDGLLFGDAGRATSLDGGFAYGVQPGAGGGSALALHAGAEGEAGPARWRGWWRERQAGYSDATWTEPSAARERGVLAEGDAGPVALTLAWVERRGADAADPTGATTRDTGRAWASAAAGLGALTLTLQGLHEEQVLPERGAQSAAGVGAAWRVGRGLTVEGSHLQAFAESGAVVSSTFTSAGAALQTREGTLAMRAGWGPELGPRLVLSGERGDAAGSRYGTLSVEPSRLGGTEGAGSAVGGRQRLAGGGALFTEERVARDPLGLVAGRVVGAALTPGGGLSLGLSGERGERLRLDGSTTARAAAGASVAWQRTALRLDARAEVRTEGKGEQWLAGGGVEWSATPRLTLALRALAADGKLSGLRARGTDGWLSAAWRGDGLSVLGRLGRVRDDREGIADRDATVAAIAVTARPARRATVALGVDAARQRVAGARDDRLAGSVRGAWAVAGPVDVAVEYARRGSLQRREIGDLDAVRAEAGVTASGVRLALGYTLAGFRGTGIEPEETDGRLYLRAVLVR
ncbi:MAG TPA: hypothetical protein VLT47_09320 [Anaeromyxobacteraceae bacterium]|nr:hypothetical protein [Anaeromyxobacteraceae bacterium]